MLPLLPPVRSATAGRCSRYTELIAFRVGHGHPGVRALLPLPQHLPAGGDQPVHHLGPALRTDVQVEVLRVDQAYVGRVERVTFEAERGRPEVGQRVGIDAVEDEN